MYKRVACDVLLLSVQEAADEEEASKDMKQQQQADPLRDLSLLQFLKCEINSLMFPVWRACLLAMCDGALKITD